MPFLDAFFSEEAEPTVSAIADIRGTDQRREAFAITGRLLRRPSPRNGMFDMTVQAARGRYHIQCRTDLLPDRIQPGDTVEVLGRAYTHEIEVIKNDKRVRYDMVVFEAAHFTVKRDKSALDHIFESFQKIKRLFGMVRN